MIDFLGREPHHADHLINVYKALPEHMRGIFYAHKTSRQRLVDAGILPVLDMPPESRAITVVSSYRDMKLARHVGRPVVLAEHGAGQSYVGTKSGSYVGAEDREGVLAVLVPGEHARARHIAAHPAIPAYAIGCPKLDHLHTSPRPPKNQTVAISFHWRCANVKETLGAHPHYRRVLGALNERFDLIGHAHPRMRSVAAGVYEKRGVEFVPEFTDVIDRATVYACDNSSTIFEWASLDRPVVVLNAPWFRRDVNHGMRFWEFADIGPQAEGPHDVADAIDRAMEDSAELQMRRREITAAIYGKTDGRAAERAAAALMEIHG